MIKLSSEQARDRAARYLASTRHDHLSMLHAEAQARIELVAAVLAMDAELRHGPALIEQLVVAEAGQRLLDAVTDVVRGRHDSVVTIHGPKAHVGPAVTCQRQEAAHRSATGPTLHTAPQSSANRPAENGCP